PSAGAQCPDGPIGPSDSRRRGRSPSASCFQGSTCVPPNVTTRAPSESKNQSMPPSYWEQRDPSDPDHHWFPPASSPMIRSFDPLSHEVLSRKTEEPSSKLKLRSSLPIEALPVIVIEPGFEL